MSFITNRIVLALAGLAWACSGDTSDETGTNAEPLCDGSDAIRLELSTGGGFVPAYYSTIYPYGYSFVFVDGKCNYWVSPGMRGVRSARLAEPEAAALAKSVAWDRLAALAGPDQSCPDAGTTVIRSSEHVVTCSCGCDTTEKELVFEKLPGVVEELWQSGAESDLPLAAWRSVEPPTSTQNALPWPLSWPITDLIELGSNVGTVISSAADRSALRASRAAWAEKNAYFESITIQVGTTYHGLVLRDDLPPAVAAAVDAFQVTAPSP